MTSYDDWKTTEPDPYEPKPLGECDCCEKERVLSRCWAFGIETWACDECLEMSGPLGLNRSNQ